MSAGKIGSKLSLVLFIVLSLLAATAHSARAQQNGAGATGGGSCDQSPVPREMQIQIGKQLCETNHDESDAHDPCNMAKLNDKAESLELVSEIGYGLAAGYCTAECAWKIPGACTWATLGVSSADLAGAIWLASESDQMMGALQAKMGGIAAQGTTVITSSLGKEAGERSGRWKVEACLAAVTNAGQAVARHVNRSNIKEEMDNQYAQKWCMMRSSLGVSGLSGGVDGAGTANASGGGGIRGDISMSGNGPLSEQAADARANAAFSKMTAQQQSFFNEAFNRGDANAKELMKDVLTGKSPNGYLAALKGIGAGKLGNDGVKAGKEIASLADQVAKTHGKKFAEADRKYNPNSSSALFGSSSSGGARSAKAEANPFAGLTDMLGQMMPGQKKAEQDLTGSARNVNFGSRGPAAEALARREGLHTSDQSLFDVVGSRYQSIARKYLQLETEAAGHSNAAAESPTTLPANPYLGR